MSDLYLITECTGFAELFLEENKQNGNTRFRGKFQEADAVNKNKRLYPYSVLNNNVERLFETINARGLVGELDHPTDSILHFENASHLITKLWWEGNTLMGEGEILPTPAGMILKALTEAGIRWGISSRGVGNGQTNSEGVMVIGESYRLITFDAVADPSTFSAFQQKVKGQKTESVIKNINNSEFSSKNEDNRINRINKEVLLASLSSMIEKQTQILREDIRERI